VFRFIKGRTRVEIPPQTCVFSPTLNYKITVEKKKNRFIRGENESRTKNLPCESPRQLIYKLQSKRKTIPQKKYEGRTTTLIIILPPVIKKCDFYSTIKALLHKGVKKHENWQNMKSGKIIKSDKTDKMQKHKINKSEKMKIHKNDQNMKKGQKRGGMSL